MNESKNSARVVGGLLIVGTVSGVLSVVISGSVLDSPNYLIEASSNEGKMIVGALFVLLMGIALSMVPVVLFPILKKYNEALALGAVVFRGVLEAIAYMMIVIHWLQLLALSHEYVKINPIDNSSYFLVLGTFLVQATEISGQILAIVFSIGALMIYYVFYQSKLIPSWLSIWGIFGAIMYLSVPLLSMFGFDWEILYMPLAIQEMVLAVWLIIVGFNSSIVASNVPKETT